MRTVRARHVGVVGAAVTALVFSVLSTIGRGDAAGPTVSRIAGANRFDTARLISAVTFISPPVPVAFVARGDAYEDALAGMPAAAVDGGPMLLVDTGDIPPETAAELTRLHPGRIVVLGGPSAVTESVVSALQAYTPGTVTRLAGADRYGTAAAVSAATFSRGVGAAYIATDLSFADALAGGAAAGMAKDPILITQQGAIPQATAQELTRLRPSQIFILGGTAAVSDAVASQLGAYTTGSVSRLAGADRYATAVAISQASFASTAAAVYLATGLNFPDALAGGVAAALAPGPLLLVPGTCVPSDVSDEIGRLSPAKVYILGGDGAVGPAVDTLNVCSTGTTTTTSSSVAFVQADDTGTINGNTTSISSGQSNQVLAHDTGVGHSVVLMIQTLTDPGTQTNTVTSVSSGMGTFQFVNSYNDGADFEIWVCTNTTGAADTVTVNTPTNAWDALAIEFNEPATGFINGSGQVVDLPYLGQQSWELSPGAAGNLAVVGADTLDAYESAPAAPWTYYNSGYWSFSNGTSAAWQVAPSSSPLTATWVQDGGLSSSQGVVLQY